MTAQAYFILTEDQKTELTALVSEGRELGARLIDHPFASNLGISFDDLYALPAAIVNDSNFASVLPRLLGAQFHILDGDILFAPKKEEPPVEEPNEPEAEVEPEPTIEPSHVEPVVHADEPSPSYYAPVPVVPVEPMPMATSTVTLPADTETHN